MDHLCYLRLVFVMLSRLFIAAFRSSSGKGLTSWLLFVMFNCVFVTFPCGILGQVWYFIVSIRDLCRLSYFYSIIQSCQQLSIRESIRPPVRPSMCQSWRQAYLHGQIFALDPAVFKRYLALNGCFLSHAIYHYR